MKCMKNIFLGLGVASMIGAGLIIYKMSPKAKKAMCQFEKDMCKDFENMI